MIHETRRYRYHHIVICNTNRYILLYHLPQHHLHHQLNRSHSTNASAASPIKHLLKYGPSQIHVLSICFIFTVFDGTC